MLAACGGDEGDGAPTPTTSPVGVIGELGAKPEVQVPAGEAPPAELQIEDVVVGDGAEAAVGSTITVHYVGVSWSTGAEFDASWDRDEPLMRELVFPGLIEGWVQGIPGMREGGRRRLVIPPTLAYGEQGAPPAGIGPNEALVFVIDLLGVDGA